MSENANFTLVDSNEHFIVINKNQAVDFHDNSDETGLFNQVKQSLALTELYPVHRLDKVTTGLLIMAKTAESATHFQHLFATRQMNKFYVALSDQKPNKKQGLITGDMEKARRGAWKLLRSKNNPAITQFFSYGTVTGCRLFVLKPHSGKTHQLRVAMSSLGAPIAGDPLYSKTADQHQHTYLHAYALAFTLFGQSYSYLQLPFCGLWQVHEIQTLLTEKLNSPLTLPWPAISSKPMSA